MRYVTPVSHALLLDSGVKSTLGPAAVTHASPCRPGSAELLAREHVRRAPEIALAVLFPHLLARNPFPQLIRHAHDFKTPCRAVLHHALHRKVPVVVRLPLLDLLVDVALSGIPLGRGLQRVAVHWKACFHWEELDRHQRVVRRQLPARPLIVGRELARLQEELEGPPA